MEQIIEFNKTNKVYKNSAGQVIVELLVAMGLASFFLPAIISGFVSGNSGKIQQQQRLKAQAYLTEAVEAVRSIRESDWTNVSVNGTYHPMISADCVNAGGNVWRLCSGPEILDGFSRTVVIGDLNPADPSIKEITITVSWNNILPSSVESKFYLSRWKNLTSTLAASGEMINYGSGDWCSPALNINSLDLPKSGVANAVWAIQGQLAAGTGDNASGVSYANVLVTDPAAPASPSASIAGTFDGYKTNDVFTETNYAYLATDTNSKEVVIINLTSISGGKYAEAGYFNAPGNGNAASIATSGNIGYMVGGTKMYSFDLSSKTGSRPAMDTDGLTLPGTAKKIMIVGQRAYVVTESLSAQLVIIDISNPNNLVLKGQSDLNGSEGVSLYVNSDMTRAYVVTEASPTMPEMFIVNIDESSSGFRSTVNSYDTNGMNPKGVILVNIPRIIIVGTGGEEYQVVNVSDETASTLPKCGGLELNSGINAVATVFTAAQRAYSYIVTGDASAELKIIEGGAGGGGTGAGVTADSAILDAGHTSIFNRFSVNSVTPSDVTATYQVAVSGDCSTFNFTGNYSANGGVIPLSINPGRCFRYRVTFSGGSGSGPVSTEITVNYSP